MKEASGEANMTVATIILIGVVVAVATPLLTNMMKGTSKKACCSNNGGIWNNGQCYQYCDTDENGHLTGCSGSISTECK